MRADARRNYERILAAAGAAIAQHGVEASLEEIARHAGVGSATLHRHFPSRQALLEAVFRDRVETLCAKARDLATEPDREAALVTWLHAVGAHAVTNKGLGAALMPGAGDPTLGDTCHTLIVNAGKRTPYAPRSPSPSCSNSSEPLRWPPNTTMTARPKPTAC
jgi:AcrR family transcriptional regulator